MSKLLLLYLFLLNTYSCAGETIQWQNVAYEIISQIGDGDKAIVYHVRDQNNYSFALKKFYPKNILNCPQEVLEGMFDNEGRSLQAEEEYIFSKRIEHPNILKIYDLFHVLNESNTLDTYLIMEYIDGQTLRTTRSKSHSKLKTLQNLENFISALKYCYGWGFVNHDLHSTNIMFDSHSNIKIIDLGSFDEISSLEEFEPKKYLQAVRSMIISLLQCGCFTNEEMFGLSQLIFEIDIHLEIEEYLKKILELIINSNYFNVA